MKPSTINVITEHGEPFEIPEGGSLGLLALGYIGVMLWREKQKETQMKKRNEKKRNEKA